MPYLSVSLKLTTNTSECALHVNVRTIVSYGQCRGTVSANKKRIIGQLIAVEAKTEGHVVDRANLRLRRSIGRYSAVRESAGWSRGAV